MLPVTGANRGVGLALVQDLLENKPSAVVFAGVRKIDSLKAIESCAIVLDFCRRRAGGWKGHLGESWQARCRHCQRR
jgi:NAD(P)-dependent dehydrogenase (short-subunit alcohol dehydrogenase family)